MKLKITQRNIDDAGFTANNCPVAQALLSLGYIHPCVTKYNATYLYGGKRYRFSLNDQLARFVWAWDFDKLTKILPFETEYEPLEVLEW